MSTADIRIRSAEVAAAERRGAARGWDEGWDACSDAVDDCVVTDGYGPCGECATCRTPNPYRADREETA